MKNQESQLNSPPDDATMTPAQLGYRMPAEWEPHEATWIAWPHHRDDWPGKFPPVPWVYTEVVRLLTRYEHVNILIKGRKAIERVAARLDSAGANLDRVTFVKAMTDRVWVRDSGPTFVKNDRSPSDTDRVGLIDWRFNGWAKYENHHHDAKIVRKIAKLLELRRWTPRVEIDGRSTRVVLEGGAIDVNGKGTLLTTEECLLSAVQARNPGLGREDIAKVFADFLGVSHVVWLANGIEGDDTHGHIDDIARFVGPKTIVSVVEHRKSSPNYEHLQENSKRLGEARDQDGDPFEVIALPMPEPVSFEGQPLPASYANFYIANGIVIVPTFNDPNDRMALSVLATIFPDRDVIGVHALDLVLGLGTLHCLTQQQPAAGIEPEAVV